MKNLLNPKWLLLINTAPIVLLGILFYSQFTIIKTLLEPESVALWKTGALILGIAGGLNLVYTLFLILGITGGLNFVYTLFLILTKRKVTLLYAILGVVAYSSITYFFGMYSSDILPFNIPRWMQNGDITIYGGTFLMPTILYCIIAAVLLLTKAVEKYKPWKSFVMAIAIPLIWFLISQTIIPLLSGGNSGFFDHALIVLTVLATIVFLFFIIRGIYLLAARKSKKWKTYQLFWKIPIAILFPLLGLAVNSGYIFDPMHGSSTGIFFGDFNGIWFYGIAFLNGILLCLPNKGPYYYRLFLYVGRCITFSYTLYFFFVFLPFLPLSIIASM